MHSPRFTLDGGEALERHLARTCDNVLRGVRAILPPHRLEAIVLGGGYGRGEGGVYRTPGGERPYNDLDFYVFLRGKLWWNERWHGEDLRQLGEELSVRAGLHVEFKIDSLDRMRRGTISMFNYDLVSRHRLLWGEAGLFAGCAHLRDAAKIPASEATRLLFNRCSGLLLAGEFLRNRAAPMALLWRGEGTLEFVTRNLAKARLALGDALLTALGRYHWSCLERGRRLAQLRLEQAPFLSEIRRHHAAGIKFKLHPRLPDKPASLLARELKEVSALARELWLWIESRRLNCHFDSVRDYALDEREKCPGNPAWRNFFLNVKTFGFRQAFHSMARRYPRERLFNALCLLLWNGDRLSEPGVLEALRRQLGTRCSQRAGLVHAYAAAWPGYG